MAFATNTGFGFGQSNNQSSGTGFGGFGSSNTTNTGMSHFPSMNLTSTWSGVHAFVLRCLASDRTKSSSNVVSGECRIWHKHKQYWLWKHCSNNKPFQRIRVKHWRYVGLSRSIAYHLLAQRCAAHVSFESRSTLRHRFPAYALEKSSAWIRGTKMHP